MTRSATRTGGGVCANLTYLAIMFTHFKGILVILLALSCLEAGILHVQRYALQE